MYLKFVCVSVRAKLYMYIKYFKNVFRCLSLIFTQYRSGFSDTATLFQNFHARMFNLRSIHLALFLYLTVLTCWAGKEIIFIQEKRDSCL